MIDRSVDDRLRRVKERLKKLVNEENLLEDKPKTLPEELALDFGLSVAQAKAWLKKEPNYPYDISRRFLTEKKDRRGLDSTAIFNMPMVAENVNGDIPPL